MRTLTALLATCGICAALAACDSSSGTDETEPTFEQAQAIAEQQLAGEGCEFQVEDESTDETEQKALNCLVTAGGEEQLYSILLYTRDLETEESEVDFGGITTSDHYFENGNISVEPSGGDPIAIQLDGEEFSTALKEECSCGEVLTPEA